MSGRYNIDTKITDIENLPRFINLIKESIIKLDLNLQGLSVLTEGASSNYICTPLIAAMGGSEKVYAYVKDTNYGKAKDIINNIDELAKFIGIKERIVFVKTWDNEILSDVDIITNLGPLRPITADFIANIKETAAIPLMREPWEFREGEIDLKACKKRGIIVMGTNENHPDLSIFDYLGHLCAKKLFDLNIEIFKSKIVVVGGGAFGINILKYLVKLGSKVKSICDEEEEIINELGAEKIGFLKSGKIDLSKIKNSDAIIIASYPNKKEMIGPDAIIDIASLEELAPGVSIVQFKGNVNRKAIKGAQIPIIPIKPPFANHMSWTLNDLGPKPVIDLHTAGLKVGEIITKKRLAGKSYNEAIEMSLKDLIISDFDEHQKRIFFN